MGLTRQFISNSQGSAYPCLLGTGVEGKGHHVWSVFVCCFRDWIQRAGCPQSSRDLAAASWDLGFQASITHHVGSFFFISSLCMCVRAHVHAHIHTTAGFWSQSTILRGQFWSNSSRRANAASALPTEPSRQPSSLLYFSFRLGLMLPRLAPILLVHGWYCY